MKKSLFWLWIHASFILLGLAGIIAAATAIGFYLRSYSCQLANSPGYEEIRFMRAPVLFMMESVVVLFLIAALLAVAFIILILRGRGYSRPGVRLLRVMGSCFLLMLIPCLALVLYTRAHVAGSITNLWVAFGALLALIAGNLLFLFANQLQKGCGYKDENELTV